MIIENFPTFIMSIFVNLRRKKNGQFCVFFEKYSSRNFVLNFGKMLFLQIEEINKCGISVWMNIVYFWSIFRSVIFRSVIFWHLLQCVFYFSDFIIVRSVFYEVIFLCCSSLWRRCGDKYANTPENQKKVKKWKKKSQKPESLGKSLKRVSKYISKRLESVENMHVCRPERITLYMLEHEETRLAYSPRCWLSERLIEGFFETCENILKEFECRVWRWQWL